MSPTILHSAKGKTMERRKSSVVVKGLGGGRDESAKHRKLLGQ